MNQSTPQAAWQALEHTPATEPIPLSVLEAKAAEYSQNRKLNQLKVGQAQIAVSKAGAVIDSELFADPVAGLASNQILVEVVREQRKVFYKGQQISVPSSMAGRQYCRTVTGEEFLLSDPDTGEVVMSFPLPLMAMQKSGKFIASYSIRGIMMLNPTKAWASKAEFYRKEYEVREEQMPEVFTHA